MLTFAYYTSDNHKYLFDMKPETTFEKGFLEVSPSSMGCSKGKFIKCKKTPYPSLVRNKLIILTQTMQQNSFSP